MLDQGKIRNSAEKAWGATKRATDALVLAREGEEPQSAGQARAFEVSRPGSGVRHPARAISHQGRGLHINCFYDGNCEPEQEMADLIIRATILYIALAERLSKE